MENHETNIRRYLVACKVVIVQRFKTTASWQIVHQWNSIVPVSGLSQILSPPSPPGGLDMPHVLWLSGENVIKGKKPWPCHD